MTPSSGETARTTRDAALDYTKGVLVFTMVLYHWMNYFIATQYLYRYLRFLTPSFIFITGFLISHTYLPRYRTDDWRVPKKLVRRGLKILGVFLMLNVAIGGLAIAAHGGRVPAGALSIDRLAAVYVTGNVLQPGGAKLASFAILVPIAYVLLLSAVLLPVLKTYRRVFLLAPLAGLALVLALYLRGAESPNLELVTIGLLGVASGCVSTGGIQRLVRRPAVLLAAYAVYLAVITAWNVQYPVQVIGVYLTLALIYASGSKLAAHRLAAPIVVAGQYSLFAYIGQLMILQGLRIAPWHLMLGAAQLPLSFLAAVCLTTLLIEAVDRARATAPVVDRVYSAVFS
jgi:acyltransferase-like protein